MKMSSLGSLMCVAFHLFLRTVASDVVCNPGSGRVFVYFRRISLGVRREWKMVAMISYLSLSTTFTWASRCVARVKLLQVAAWPFHRQLLSASCAVGLWSMVIEKFSRTSGKVGLNLKWCEICFSVGNYRTHAALNLEFNLTVKKVPSDTCVLMTTFCRSNFSTWTFNFK